MPDLLIRFASKQGTRNHLIRWEKQRDGERVDFNLRIWELKRYLFKSYR